jgi:8-amino-7-oxononanoate synthase
VILGESLKAATLSDRLSKRDINVMPILHPAVAERHARLRFFITAEHTRADIEAAIAATAEEIGQLAETGDVIATLSRSLG